MKNQETLSYEYIKSIILFCSIIRRHSLCKSSHPVEIGLDSHLLSTDNKRKFKKYQKILNENLQVPLKTTFLSKKG